MEKIEALAALSALGQETRLDVFRLLVVAGEQGMLAGQISDALDLRANTLSANLTILLNAGLIRNKREGRAIRYFSNMDGMRDLLQFLTEDCCGGNPTACLPNIRN